ncbi:MAG TPA: protein-methionine-sulfoxide reductase heme-binding subunit MsrQ [Thermodesulfobacteriota bacterium]
MVLGLALLPLGLGVYWLLTGRLGPNPIEAATRHLGWWGLALLLVSLAVTPLRQLTGWNRAIRLRRMLGLVAFGYVALHVTNYVAVDHFFDWRAIGADIVKRPYITVGMTAFLLLVPLAVTSTDGWVRRLGGKRWQRLHYLVYPAAVLGVVHYFLLVKADTREPALFAAALAALLGYRVWRRALKRRGAARRRPERGAPAGLTS